MKFVLNDQELKELSQKVHLLTPGPVSMPKVVVDELAKPMIHHRSPEFEKILSTVLLKLKALFQTDQDVFLQTSTGSGGMESAIVNTLSPGDSVLVICSGKFGDRWADIAERLGCQVDRWKVNWGESIDPEKLKAMLDKKKYRAVLCQACESSTGVIHPIEEMGDLMRPMKDTLLMVDGVSAVGAVLLPMDHFCIDVLVTGSQKGLMLPTGLSFISFSKKAWAFVEQSKMPKYYFDIIPEKKANQKSQTRFSSAVSMIRALNASLDLILKDGLDRWLAIVQKRAFATREAVQRMGLKIFSHYPSPSVTCFRVPENIDGEKLISELKNRFNIHFAGGQDDYVGKILRIGHMGAIEDKDMLYCFEKLAIVLNELDPENFKIEDLKASLIDCKRTLDAKEL